MQRQHYSGTKAAVCSTQGKLHSMGSPRSTNQAPDFQEKEEHNHLQSWTTSLLQGKPAEPCLQQHHFSYKPYPKEQLRASLTPPEMWGLGLYVWAACKTFLALKASHPQHLFEGSNKTAQISHSEPQYPIRPPLPWPSVICSSLVLAWKEALACKMRSQTLFHTSKIFTVWNTKF